MAVVYPYIVFDTHNGSYTRCISRDDANMKAEIAAKNQPGVEFIVYLAVQTVLNRETRTYSLEKAEVKDETQ